MRKQELRAEVAHLTAQLGLARRTADLAIARAEADSEPLLPEGVAVSEHVNRLGRKVARLKIQTQRGDLTFSSLAGAAWEADVGSVMPGVKVKSYGLHTRLYLHTEIHGQEDPVEVTVRGDRRGFGPLSFLTDKGKRLLLVPADQVHGTGPCDCPDPGRLPTALAEVARLTKQNADLTDTNDVLLDKAADVLAENDRLRERTQPVDSPRAGLLPLNDVLACAVGAFVFAVLAALLFALKELI